MKNRLVQIPAIKEPIQASGFRKKQLADFKLDICGLCGFGCRYCSSNAGLYLQYRKNTHAKLTLEQLGVPATPGGDPDLMYLMPDVLEHLDTQLSQHRPSWGRGKTLVSQLTDGFSPELVKRGTTEAALRMVLERTEFRVRVLTKNATVGSKRWINFFSSNPGRFVVGLSCGTLDDAWAKKVEIGTSSPSARLRALRGLQDAGVPTFGMLCPVFPGALADDGLKRLVDEVRPALVEHLWAEPFNDRQNWRHVRDAHAEGSVAYGRVAEIFDTKQHDAWSAYATELYTRLRARAQADGWVDKLRYLLYEDKITAADAGAYRGLEGVLLQSKPDDYGNSKNPYIRAVQGSD